MAKDTSRTIGLDLGDRWTHVCVLEADGEVAVETRVPTTRPGIAGLGRDYAGCRFALETGTHALWIARDLEELGCEVIVANARTLELITRNQRKTDRADAELLARLARVDPQLLAPIRPRSEQVQADRALVTARDTVVHARTKLVNHVRGIVKSFGLRLPKSSTACFPKAARPHLPESLRPALEPLLDEVVRLTSLIRSYDRQIDEVSAARYPVTQHLREIQGVGRITALVFVLAIENPHRFRTSRQVGAYVGLCPRQDQSGAQDPQLRITKAGNPLLRRLLLQCAHYTLGPFGEDSDLRRWAEIKCAHGGRAAKKRALVAVARKLAVRMHRIWVTGEVYDPLYMTRARGELEEVVA